MPLLNDDDEDGTERTLTELKEIVKEFLYHSKGLFAVRVQKLVFCADLYATERYGARVSQADFKPRMYGAYSESIRTALDQLEKEISTTAGRRKGKKTTKYQSNEPGDRRILRSGRKRVIQNVYRATEDLSEDDLTKISKENELIRDAEYNQVLDFNKYRKKLVEGKVTPKLWVAMPDEDESGSSDMPSGLIPLSEE